MNDISIDTSEYRRRADFALKCGEMDGHVDNEKPHLAGCVYMDVSIGDDHISGWVRPEVSRRIKAVFAADRAAPITGNDMAFPVLDRNQTPNDTTQLGLTKREYFAAMAMQGLLAAESENFGYSDHEKLARAAVVRADALLRELAK